MNMYFQYIHEKFLILLEGFGYIQKLTNKNIYLYLFGKNTIQISKDHIEKILSFNNIPKNDYNKVYIESPFSEDKNLLTFDYFDNTISKENGKEIHKIQNSEIPHLAAGFGGAFKNKKGFGTDAEAKKAKRAGYSSIAKYKNDRFPYRESYNIF